jgi:tetratricopeptide (TPR) repeat protein
MSRSILRAAALMGCLLAVSCRISPTGTFLGPSIGSQPWWLVRSKHFTVRSDTGEAETREIAIDLERTYRILLDLGFPMEKDPGITTDVVVFRTAEDYGQIGPRNTAGMYTGGIGRWAFARPTFLTFGGISERARPTFVHELTHRFVHFTFPQAPLWLNEGLAEYFETVAVDGGKAILGRSSHVVKRGGSWTMGAPGVPIDALPPVDQLVAMGPKEFYASRGVKAADDSEEAKEAARRQVAAYVSAWSLVHTLKNGSPDNAARFDAWLRRMAQGETAQSAFDAAFAEVSLDQLAEARAAMLERLATGEIGLLRTDYEAAGEPPIEDRAMRPAEVHVLWGWMNVRKGKSGVGEAHRRAELALEAEPDMVEAHHLQATVYQMKDDALGANAEIEAAARIAPDDEAAAYALFSFQSHPPRGIERTPAKLAAADATAARWQPRAKIPGFLNDLAWHMTWRGRAEDAVPVAKRSTELDPSCAICFDTLAVALFRSGQYRTAIEVQEVAVALSGENGRGGELDERLELFRAVNSAIVLWKKRPDPGQDPALLPARVVDAIVLAQRPQVNDCHESGLWKNKKLAGTVVVRGQIGQDGKVTGAAALPAEEWGSLAEKPKGKPLPDASVTACIVAHVAATRFPPSGGTTQLTAPFHLEPPPEKE